MAPHSLDDWFLVLVVLWEAFMVGRIWELWRRRRGESYFYVEPSPFLVGYTFSTGPQP